MIYLDHHATTPTRPEVCDIVDTVMRETFANPHSITHSLGWEAGNVVEIARGKISRAVGAKSTDVIFTSGATESNNMMIKGVPLTRPRNKILISAIEHPCIMESAKYMQNQGAIVKFIPVLSTGRVDIEVLQSMLDNTVALVSVMLVNNEIGTIQDIAKIGKLAHNVGAVMHSDVAQGLGRISVHMRDMNLDAISLSGHKIYGTKGVGALVLNRRVKLTPLIHGGGQEKGLRSGTLSPPLCAGLGLACEMITTNIEDENTRIGDLRNTLQNILLENIEGAYVLGDMKHRVAGTLSLFVPNVDGGNFFSRLKGVAISSGSACASSKSGGSYVLRSIGLNEGQEGVMLRMCVGMQNTIDDIHKASKSIIKAIG